MTVLILDLSVDEPLILDESSDEVLILDDAEQSLEDTEFVFLCNTQLQQGRVKHPTLVVDFAVEAVVRFGSLKQTKLEQAKVNDPLVRLF